MFRAITLSAVALGLSLVCCDAEAGDVPTTEEMAAHYTPERILEDLTFIHNEQNKSSLSTNDYVDDVFCKDPDRLRFIVWLAVTEEVREEIKTAIFKAMGEAERLYCTEVS